MTTASAPPGIYRWYVLAVLTLAQTCHGIDRAIIGLVLKPLGAEFSMSGAQLGLLAGVAYGVPFAIAAIPFGYAVDRMNRTALMTFALAAWSGATALCGAATGFCTLAAGRAAVGVAEAGGSPTGMSLLADYFGTDRRATAIGIWYLSAGVGFALAFFAGGWIVAEHGWRWAFVAAGVPGLILAPLLYFTVREPVRGRQDAPQEHGDHALRARLGMLFARPGMAYAIAAITCIATGIYGMSTWLATFLVDSHGFGLPQAGLVVAIAYGILGSVGGLTVGWGSDRINASRGGFDPANTAWPHLRGLAVSAVQMSANLIGVGLGAWLIGMISDQVGGKDGVAWGIGAAMLFCIAGGVLLLLASRAIRRHDATPHHA